MSKVCEFCGGTGKLGFQQEDCWYCGGKGYMEGKEEIIYFYAMNRYGDVDFFDKCNGKKEFNKLKEVYWNKDNRLTLHILSKEEYDKQINNEEWTQDSFNKDLELTYESNMLGGKVEINSRERGNIYECNKRF